MWLIPAAFVMVLPAVGAESARPGCAPTRPATAYDRAGKVLTPQPAAAPVPCLTATGYATVETHISVTKDGAVVYQPAVVMPGLAGSAFVPGAPGPHPWQPTSPAGLAVSHDQGGTWAFVKPAASYWTSTDGALYTDPTTGQLFGEQLSPGQVPSGGQLAPQDQTPGGHAVLLTSPDDGKNWDYTSLTGFLYQENARFTSAAPPPGQARTAGGYPDVTYWCGNRDVGLQEPLILERECYRSLDAGATWEMRAILATTPVSQHPECGASRDDLNSYDGNYPQGAPDGSLYLIVSCTAPTDPAGHGGTIYLARSTDEAATFPVLSQRGRTGTTHVTLPVPAGADWPELRIGRDAMFLTYEFTTPSGPTIQVRTAPLPAASNGPVLTAPLAWSQPVTLTPPGLGGIDNWAVAVRGSEVVVSYLGQPRKASGARNGYLSVTRDAAAPAPVVWNATVNDPRSPLLDGAPQSAKDDFIGVDIGPDGTPWASYFSPCSAEPAAKAQTDPACESAYLGGQPISIEGGNDRGVVGSLLLR
ncbi:MAG: sialidase family protein [Acidimicrobiales bacterium]